MLTEVAAWCFRFFVRYSIITGAVKNRDEQVTAFQNDCQPDSGPGVTVFIGQIATAGLGITLTAASTMVFYSLGYSMSNFEQTKARIHRVGQRNACTYIYLTAKGTVDEKVLRALRDEKQQTEDELKRINAEIEETDNQLSALMLDTETQNFTRSGTMFCLMGTTRASATAGYKDALFTALRGAGFGDLIYETVNANSLSAFFREQIGENGDALPAWLDGLVKVYEKTTVGVRKAPRK